MKKLLLPLFSLSLALLACDKPAEPAVVTPAAGPIDRVETSREDAPALVPPAAIVTLPAEGARFDPPVEASAIPEGAWYCDMGTVHYAQPDKGDGTCPVCGMLLSAKD